MQRNRAIDIIVGLFVVAGIAALVMLAFQVGNLGAADLDRGYKVSARFDNIGGLAVKAPVTVAGVRVGRVTSIRVESDDYRAVVEMNIMGRHDNLPRDTSASILTAGLLGAQYIGLDPGGDDVYLGEGDEIRLTQSAVILENLIGQFLFSQAQGGGD